MHGVRAWGVHVLRLLSFCLAKHQSLVFTFSLHSGNAALRGRTGRGGRASGGAAAETSGGVGEEDGEEEEDDEDDPTDLCPTVSRLETANCQHQLLLTHRFCTVVNPLTKTIRPASTAW